MRIKHLRFAIFIGFIFIFSSRAECKRVHHYYAPSGMISFYSQAGFFVWDAQPGIFSVSFPYTITTLTAAPYHGTFSANINNLVGTGKFYYSLVGMEIG